MLNFYVKLKGVRSGKSIRRFIFHLVQYYKPLNKLPCVGGCCERTFFLFLFRWRGVGFLLASGEVWGRFGQPLHEILSQHDQDQGRYRKRDRTIWQSELVIVCWPWMFFYVRPPSRGSSSGFVIVLSRTRLGYWGGLEDGLGMLKDLRRLRGHGGGSFWLDTAETEAIN